MSGNILHEGATITCPHGGWVGAPAPRSQARADGRRALTVADQTTVTGCPFTAGGQPRPCVTVRWVTPAGRVRLDGSPALLQSSTGVCLSADGVAQGPPHVSVVQQRVVGR